MIDRQEYLDRLNSCWETLYCHEDRIRSNAKLKQRWLSELQWIKENVGKLSSDDIEWIEPRHADFIRSKMNVS